MKVLYSESRLMLSPVDVIIRLMLSPVYVIIRFMWSLLIVPFTNADLIKTTGLCNHSFNIITFGLTQSDPIKRLLLYNKNY